MLLFFEFKPHPEGGENHFSITAPLHIKYYLPFLILSIDIFLILY